MVDWRYKPKTATIAELVERLATDQKTPDAPIFIPSLQREFCWNRRQILSLFDSLLRGLPTSSLLLWEVKGGIAQSEAAYRFIQNYAEMSAYPSEEKFERDKMRVLNKSRREQAERIPAEYTFALDGQQRLTSLLIGLQGTYYRHRERKWKHRLNSYTERHLCIDVLADPDERDSRVEELKYRLDFPRSLGATEKGDTYWWTVSEIWNMDRERLDREIDRLKTELPVTQSRASSSIEKNLTRLYEIIYEQPLLLYEDVLEMNSEEALELFVRRNDGGEPLNNSDIAFSLMSVYWSSFKEDAADPKEEIEEYTRHLEKQFGVYGFGFDKGFVVRTLLMLANKSPSFRRDNLTPDTIRQLESVWIDSHFRKAVEQSLKIVTERIGFGDQCLTSTSVVLPLIYYCYRRLRAESVEIDTSDEEDPLSDRLNDEIVDQMEYWLCVTALNTLFTIGSETVLRAAQREIQREGTGSAFPVDKILRNFRGRGIELTISKERLGTLVEETGYSSGAAKHLLLTKAYSDGRISGVPLNRDVGSEGEVHPMEVDHIFPQSKLNADDKTDLYERGLNSEEIRECVSNMHRLGNLQLLPQGAEGNQSKGNKDPDDWLLSFCEEESEEEAQEIIERHLLPYDCPDSYQYKRFVEFCEDREQRLLEALIQNLPLDAYRIKPR